MKYYEWIGKYEVNNLDDIINITDGKKIYSTIKDQYSKIQLFNLSLLTGEKELKTFSQTGYADKDNKHKKNKGGLKKLLHTDKKYEDDISKNLKLMKDVELTYNIPKMNELLVPSFYINFKFTLKKPFISADEQALYIIDNPVKKEKVFKIPIFPASGWKGVFRWTMMKKYLQDKVENLTVEEFAKERLGQALLFGNEKGIEASEFKGWAEYLNNLKPGNWPIFADKLLNHFGLKDTKLENLSFKGRLNFCTTFFDKIDMTVLNPHDRKTKTGKDPIWMECVPEGATGNFSLLYFPYDLIGRNNIENIVQEDFNRIAGALKDLFLVYGFSAKKSSGFGTSFEEIEDGRLVSNIKINDDFEETDNKEYIRNISTLKELGGEGS